jgi:hypothetical protein
MSGEQTGPEQTGFGKKLEQKPRGPIILWGRLIAVTALFVTTVLVLSFGVPAAYGLGKSVADVTQAIENSCIAHDARDIKPLN